MYAHEVEPGYAVACCANCSKRNSFQTVMEIQSLGITVLRYADDTFTQIIPQPPTEALPEHVHNPVQNNVFIIINANEKNLSSEDILPKFNINKVPCTRCRYRAEKFHKMLQSKINVGKGDIKGICDHCKDKLLQKPCPICKDIVKKFLGAKTAKSWFKQSVPHFHRSISTVRIMESEQRHFRGRDAPKTALDLNIDFKVMEPKTELLTSARLPEKDKIPFEDKKKVIPIISKLLSDESVITPFVTSFSRAEKDVKDSFKYIFPKDVKKEADLSKVALATSSELIINTQQKIRKQLEDVEQKVAKKTQFDLDISRDNRKINLKGKALEVGQDVTNKISKDDHRRRQLNEKPSLVSSAESKGTKDVKVKISQEDVDKPSIKEKKTKKDLQPSKDAKAIKDQADIEKLTPKDIKAKKDQKVKPPPALPQQAPKDINGKKSQEDIEKQPSKDVKEIKVLPKVKDQGSIETPLSKNVKVKKDQEDIEKSQPKKDQKAIKKLPQPPPPPQPPKEKHISENDEKAKQEKAAARRADRKLMFDEDQKDDKEKAKITKDEKKGELKKEDEKKDELKKEKGSKDKKGKEDDAQIAKETVEIAEPPPAILKYIPQKAVSLVPKPIDKKQALAEAEAKMKGLQEACLVKARADAEKRFALPELGGGEYFLFKLVVKQPPTIEEEIPDKKKINLNQFNLKLIKVKSPSFENVLLNMIKKSNDEKKKTDKKNRKHLAKYKIRSAKRHFSMTSFSIDSDLELALESFTNFKKAIPMRYKIKHTSIVRDIPEKQNPKLQPDPILYHAVQKEDKPVLVYDLEEADEPKKEQDLGFFPGIIRYALSDRSYIAKGWTLLPTEKIVRKLNIYKVRPTNPEFDWFNNNKKKGSLQYDTGERLARFDNDGRGRLYYRNGRLALDYYDCEEANAQQRFVIYSDGESNEKCRTLPVTVLAMFDYLGSGVVFDHCGKIRVKYNQTEGVVLDRGIGPKTRWKWHTLNDPPILKQVMIDTQMEVPDPDIIKLGGDEPKKRYEDQEMLQIELDNFVKEKSKKLKQNFEPFQIKMKALKINEQFSLRILDQAHVYLHFKNGLTHIKINLGMLLDHQEIIDTETSDYAEVANSLEQPLPKTESILDLQNDIKQARRCEHMRTEYNKRVRSVVPVCSADKLVSAVSKPLRPPITNTCPAASGQANVQRKPSQFNLYYDTRLI